MVRKIIRPDGRLLYNLQEVRAAPREWVRPRHLPPPFPGDIGGMLEGAALGELEEKLEEFLQGADRHMRNAGFWEPPFAYRTPAVILHRGRNRRVEHPRFFLSWPRQEHAMAFYAIWNGYHWGSNHFEQVIVVNLQNDQPVGGGHEESRHGKHQGRPDAGHTSILPPAVGRAPGDQGPVRLQEGRVYFLQDPGRARKTAESN